MKVIITGATGAIGGVILQHVLRRNDITKVIALTRRALPDTNTPNAKLENIIIEDFGALENVQDETWEKIQDADAMIWAMGTYDLNEDVNVKYPLAFQEHFAKRLLASSSQEGKKDKFKFILLSGAFVEPDQSRRLFFLWDQRRMKGVLQTKTIEFAEGHREVWEAFVIRPGGVLYGGNTLLNKTAECVFGSLAIRGEELGAFVADLVVHGSQQCLIENPEMVERGRKLLVEAL
ncbi:hypothetical protein P153DRAFT_339007 [Dothidotthia symphoricarpi CBS 119687]|uniref:NAD(P)-binding domain-containing protein n=1 Tax=Dothidotthia symphoricarpi CBS 119687 TaxID=1392245 RepID=A0A6A6ADH5_9PLEO|nr:uncharacterized protein P153DRAFT_339007 [Dothidotthia symphoricarpi CBS 119687]KAF2129830.1 hypothetical protein P153DRAFT_339007 [Dothidotthia symphoricarpi CBS 119687]